MTTIRTNEWEDYLKHIISVYKKAYRFMYMNYYEKGDVEKELGKLKFHCYMYGEDIRRCFFHGRYIFTLKLSEEKWNCIKEQEFIKVTEGEYGEKFPNIWKLVTE